MNNLVWQQHSVTKPHRQHKNGHKSCCIWFTGLSGAGKSTIAGNLEWRLANEFNISTYLLDGDNVRTGLCKDLGFTQSSREENIRRIGEVSKLFVDAGVIVLSAFISPFENDRQRVREMFEPGEFIEVFVDAALEVCEQRDPKGLYAKARQGKIKDFTGLDSPYDRPISPELIVDNAHVPPETAVGLIIQYLKQKAYISDV